MPIYTYKCLECGKQFEWMQSIKSEPLTHCPEEICHLHKHKPGAVQKVFSANVGLVFKGSGFYLTDYSKKNSSGSNGNNGHGKNNENVGQLASNTQTDNKTTAK